MRVDSSDLVAKSTEGGIDQETEKMFAALRYVMLHFQVAVVQVLNFPAVARWLPGQRSMVCVFEIFNSQTGSTNGLELRGSNP